MNDYIRITKQPRQDIGRPLSTSVKVIGLAEAIDELVQFSDVKDPAEIKRSLLAGRSIYTNFNIYSR